MVSSSGFELLESDAVSAIVTDLFPLATLVTPNIPEAERISGISITDDRSLKRAAQAIQHAGGRNVLIKGGHFETNSPFSRDLLFIGDNISVFEASRLKNASVRGTGCMLSSAIAANLALGNELRTAVGIAKDHVHAVISRQQRVGTRLTTIDNTYKNLQVYLAGVKTAGVWYVTPKMTPVRGLKRVRPNAAAVSKRRPDALTSRQCGIGQRSRCRAGRRRCECSSGR